MAKKRTAVDETLRAIGAPDPDQDHAQSCLLRSSQTMGDEVRRGAAGNWIVT
jgi:hypothetical protein